MPQRDNAPRTGKTMMIAGWIIGIGLLSLLFNNVLDKQLNPNQQVATRMDDGGVREVVLQRNRYGHYVANGKINGHTVEFLLDTGASDVSVPQSLAGPLGLEPGQPITYHTANGNITAYLTRIRDLRLGNIELQNIQASINPNKGDDTILLGMSFLKHLEFTQRGDTLIIRQYP
jgi:aspartyl protease family protein